MRLYLAAAYVARDTIRKNLLPEWPERHPIKASWLLEEHDIYSGTVGAALAQPEEYVRHHTTNDFVEIQDASAVLLLTESIQRTLPGMAEVPSALFTTGGRHVECGFALAYGRPVVTVGHPENVFQRSMTTVVPTLAAALDVFDKIGRARPNA